MGPDKDKNDSLYQEGQMEHAGVQTGQDGSLSAMKDPQTALDILSHGKADRAEKVSLCPLCSLIGKETCPFPGGKNGHCVVYSLSTNVTINQVLSLIIS